MKPNEKFRIVEESRFLENGEMNEVCGGCSTVTLYTSCGGDDFNWDCDSINNYTMCREFESRPCVNLHDQCNGYQVCYTGYRICSWNYDNNPPELVGYI